MLRLFLAAATIASAASLAHADDTLEQLRTKLGLLLHKYHLPCARLIAIRPLDIADRYEVTCVGTDDGPGTVRYVLDAWAETVVKDG